MKDDLPESKDTAIESAARLKARVLADIARTKQNLRAKIYSYAERLRAEENRELRDEKKRLQADLQLITDKQIEIRESEVTPDPWAENIGSNQIERVERERSSSPMVLTSSQMSAYDYWSLEPADKEKQIELGLIPPRNITNSGLLYDRELKLSQGLIESKSRAERQLNALRAAGASDEKIQQLRPEIESQIRAEISQRWQAEYSAKLTAYNNGEIIPPSRVTTAEVAVPTPPEATPQIDLSKLPEAWQKQTGQGMRR